MDSMKMELELELECCANCCGALDYPNNSEHDEDPSEIARCLSSIFRLDYLSAFVNSPGENEDELSVIWKGDLSVRLCANCYSVFTNLWKIYQDFVQLSSVESRLTKTIQQLNDCIEGCAKKRSGKNNSQTIDKQNQSYSTSLPSGLHPHVSVKTLQNDPKASHENAHSKQRKSTKPKKKITPNQQVHSVNLLADGNLEHENDASNNSHLGLISQEADSRFHAKETQVNIDFDVELDGKPESEFEEDDDDDDDIGFDDDNEDEDEPGSSSQLLKEEDSAEVPGARVSPLKSKRKPFEPKVYKARCAKSKRMLNVYRKRKLTIPNPCWVCKLDFACPEDTYAHTIKAHSDEGYYAICQVCSCPATSKSAVTHHKKRCELLMPGRLLPRFHCLTCNCGFKSVEELREHKKEVHLESDTFTCDVDGCKFQTKNHCSFNSHKRNIHRMVEEPVDERTCIDCNRVFKSKRLYKNHRNYRHTEEGLKKYKKYQEDALKKQREKNHAVNKTNTTVCVQCNVDFLTRLALVVHQKKVHPNAIPYVCETCGSGFTRRDTLTRHFAVVHTTVRQFFCKFCGKTFKSKTNLDAHEKQTHDEQGRLEYNAKARLKNQRRKLRAQAVAQSMVMQGQGPLQHEGQGHGSGHFSGLMSHADQIPMHLEQYFNTRFQS